MPRTFRHVTVAIAIIGLLLAQLSQSLHAQNPSPTPQQLDQLLAPVALYPDALLAQITTASTDPQQVLDVVDWLARNPGLSGQPAMDAAQRQGFDPAFIAMVNFPGVLTMMAENIDDYAALGQVVLTDQSAVAASVQRLRAQAYATGALRDTTQMTVQVTSASGAPVYAIQPTNPQIVYVPYYDPTLVFVPGARVGTVVSLAPGIAIGPLLVTTSPWGWAGWGWNWGVGGIFFNRTMWHSGMWVYRSPRPWFRPLPPVWVNRPGYGGNWGYRPPNWRPPSPVRPPSHVRPGTGGRPGFSRPPAGNRPGPSRPPQNNRPGQPNRPGGPGGTQPGNRPTQPNRPGGNRPPQNNPPTQRPPSGQNPPAQRPPAQRPPAQKPSGQNPPAKQPPAQNQPSQRPSGQRPPNTNQSAPQSRPPQQQKPASRPQQQPAQKPSQPQP